MVQSPPDNAPAQDGVRLVIKPRVRGFICVTTHPAGCEANVRQQIDYVRRQGPIAGAPKRVLVIGASTGYGLAARISAAFAGGAQTLGVFFERPSEPSKPGTPGWHNSAAFHQFAQAEGLYARSINGDAFSDEIKRQVIEAIRADLGQVDQVVSAWPRRAAIHATARSTPRCSSPWAAPLRCAAWIPTARSCANPRWNRRRRTKSTPPSP